MCTELLSVLAPFRGVTTVDHLPTSHLLPWFQPSLRPPSLHPWTFSVVFLVFFLPGSSIFTSVFILTPSILVLPTEHLSIFNSATSGSACTWFEFTVLAANLLSHFLQLFYQLCGVLHLCFFGPWSHLDRCRCCCPGPCIIQETVSCFAPRPRPVLKDELHGTHCTIWYHFCPISATCFWFFYEGRALGFARRLFLWFLYWGSRGDCYKECPLAGADHRLKGPRR